MGAAVQIYLFWKLNKFTGGRWHMNRRILNSPKFCQIVKEWRVLSFGPLCKAAGGSLLTFQRNIVPLCSGLKTRPSLQQEEALTLLAACFLTLLTL
jgi:hypothetical protein